MINWGILGTGAIARVFCNGLRFSKTGRVVAAASHTPDRLHSLAADFGIARTYWDYEGLLLDPEVDAIYIATIHPMHAEWAVKAAQAEKHILVEKPIAMNHAQAQTMVDAAHANDVFLMEAFMYRCHPQTQRLAQLVSEGAIGRVQMIRAIFSYGAPFDPASRAYAYEMGGGGILDVGCYVASMSRLIAGAAQGKPFAEPLKVKGCGMLGPTGVDHYAAATLQFDYGIVGEIATGVGCSMPTDVSVYGEEGRLSVPEPWLPSSPCRSAKAPLPLDTSFPPGKIVLHRYDKPEPEEIVIPVDRDLFTYEADMVADHIAERQAPAMCWADSLGNMALLDRWRQEIGLVYEMEREGQSVG